MEYIFVCLMLLAFVYFVVFSGRGKDKPRNPYDAFAMTGIGRGGSNGVFRSRKIKNNKKRREFYITGEIAGAVLGEKSELEFEVKPVTEPYKKYSKNDQDQNQDQDDQHKHYTIPIEKEKDENQVDSLKMEDQESEKIVREILAPYQEDLSKKEVNSFVPPQHQNNIDKDLVDALEQVQLEEELQRKKTDNDFFGKKKRKASTDRYFPKGESVIDANKEKEQDILASLGIDDLLKEVNQIKEMYNDSTSQKSEPSSTTLSDERHEEMDSKTFQRKVNDILNQLPNIEDLKGNELPKVKAEKLWTRKKSYERSQAVDEWRAKLGLKNFDDV